MSTSPERHEPLAPAHAAPAGPSGAVGPCGAAAPDDERRLIQADPLRFGVGARITLSVMAEDYAGIILGALERADATGLVVETGDVSTYAGGPEDALLRYVTGLAAAVAETGRHASLGLVLSR